MENKTCKGSAEVNRWRKTVFSKDLEGKAPRPRLEHVPALLHRSQPTTGPPTTAGRERDARILYSQTHLPPSKRTKWGRTRVWRFKEVQKAAEWSKTTSQPRVRTSAESHVKLFSPIPEIKALEDFEQRLQPTDRNWWFIQHSPTAQLERKWEIASYTAYWEYGSFTTSENGCYLSIWAPGYLQAFYDFGRGIKPHIKNHSISFSYLRGGFFFFLINRAYTVLHTEFRELTHSTTIF